MSDNEIVLQKLENGLLTITMNRPERAMHSIRT